MAVEDNLDIFGADPFGRDIIYGLSTGQEPLGLTPPPQGLPVDTRPYDRMQATPRSFISGLFSDVLGRTLNMPSLPRTGIPSLDLLYANRNPLFNLMGVGDVQKTAERISYGEPLTTGSGMTTKPREETLFAGMAVAPLVGEAVNLGARGARAGARMVGQGIAENVAMGRQNLPSLLAEPRSSLFAVEPSPMMPKPQAPVSPLGFYSATEQAALNLPRNKGTGQAFLNDLMKAPDVKKDELSWIGLDDFLKDKPNVTKQEVQDFISQNKVDLQEVRLGEPPPYDKIRLATLENELSQLKEHPIDAPTFGEEKFYELLKLQNIRDQSTVDSLYSGAEVAIRNAQRAQAAGNKELANKYFLESEMLNTRAEALDLKGLGVPNPTKYSKYQLAGGENYREILLRLPNIKGSGLSAQESQRLNDLVEKRVGSSLAGLTDAEQQEYFALIKKREESASGYKSSHWDEPNILAHMRVNDRIDADGKKMLLVEEIQSDWHQAGREKGYKSQTRSTSEIQKDLDSVLAELRSKPNVSYAPSEDDWARYPEITNRYDSLAAEFDAAKENKGVPDAPFKDTWYQLALKRIMKYAADNGYERVGLTTGKQQADRYKLSNEVDEINVTGRTNMATGEKSRSVALDLKSGTSYRLGVDNNGVIDNVNDAQIANFKGKKLAEIVGKDIAKQIMEGGSQTIKGEGLNIGGEGMKKYYDEIYPKYLEKYGKKWDASVGETKISTEASPKSWAYFRDWFSKNHSDVGGSSTALANWEQGENSKYVREFLKQNKVQEPIRYIDITPKMKESVGKGQPLFTAIPAGTLGLGGLEYTDPFANPLAEDTTR